ncbi:metal ABC transporter solute-binding protein, Zn/Mn family [Alkalilacustris brevis]|uniref:metal ABC transporter solute-binding protein, Zn/Mn family n=1 Tax=Alkalilacustris brevis TaxID=2026338 RepID=UPI000E0DD8DF|nr:zinc ABC transporter substrate-binding protein [Alkalilacustris brevis]
MRFEMAEKPGFMVGSGKRGAAAVLALGLAFAAPGQGAAQPVPSVVATVGMIADVAASLAGECVAVQAMMGPGTDPHLYRPTSRDVRMMREADAIFHVGFGLEGALGDVLDGLQGRVTTLAVAPAAVPEAELLRADPEDFAYGVDPHLWMDVRLWSMTVAALSEALSDLAPDCADEIAAAAEDYRARLAALHAWVGDSIATIPEGHRALVTAHDAFAYYARAYGIDEVAIQGLSTESEASIADIREAAEAVATRGVPAVFIETTINPRTIEALLDAVRNRGHAARIGGALYSDAMGDTGTRDGTYIGMIIANTRTITAALGGTVPDLPAPVAQWLEARGFAID